MRIRRGRHWRSGRCAGRSGECPGRKRQCDAAAGLQSDACAGFGPAQQLSAVRCVLFTNAAPGQPDAAFTEENDGTEAEIAVLERQGYLVRTRTDADTKEGRSGSTTRRDHAIASGAQMLSTDYPKAEPAKWTAYSVSFRGGVMARCNPVARNARV
jgi:Phosphoinositide phospholipase C, Ca2+-dependent